MSRPGTSSGSRTSARSRRRRRYSPTARSTSARESGKFFILRPHADRCEVLSEVELPLSDQGLNSQKIPEPVVAAAAVARGRVYFVSSDTLYAIGPKKTIGKPWKPRDADDGAGAGRAGLGAGGADRNGAEARQTVQLHARLFDAQGRFLREDNGDVVARSI